MNWLADTLDVAVAVSTIISNSICDSITDTRMEYWLLNPRGQYVTFLALTMIISFTIAFRMGLSQDIKAAWNCITKAKKKTRVSEARRRFSGLARGKHAGHDTKMTEKERMNGEAPTKALKGSGTSNARDAGLFDSRKDTIQFQTSNSPNWRRYPTVTNPGHQTLHGDTDAKRATLFERDSPFAGAMGKGLSLGTGRVEQLVGNEGERVRLRLQALKRLDRDRATT
jgi:hypothetical protein